MCVSLSLVVTGTLLSHLPGNHLGADLVVLPLPARTTHSSVEDSEAPLLGRFPCDFCVDPFFRDHRNHNSLLPSHRRDHVDWFW